jgi:hypothetical protein
LNVGNRLRHNHDHARRRFVERNLGMIIAIISCVGEGSPVVADSMRRAVNEYVPVG